MLRLDVNHLSSPGIKLYMAGWKAVPSFAASIPDHRRDLRCCTERQDCLCNAAIPPSSIRIISRLHLQTLDLILVSLKYLHRCALSVVFLQHDDSTSLACFLGFFSELQEIALPPRTGVFNPPNTCYSVVFL